jgi:hypothetical protein
MPDTSDVHVPLFSHAVYPMTSSTGVLEMLQVASFPNVYPEAQSIAVEKIVPRCISSARATGPTDGSQVSAGAGTHEVPHWTIPMKPQLTSSSGWPHGVYVHPAPQEDGWPVMKAQSGAQLSAMSVPIGTQLCPQRTMLTAPQLLSNGSAHADPGSAGVNMHPVGKAGTGATASTTKAHGLQCRSFGSSRPTDEQLSHCVPFLPSGHSHEYSPTASFVQLLSKRHGLLAQGMQSGCVALS